MRRLIVSSLDIILVIFSHLVIYIIIYITTITTINMEYVLENL